MNAKLILIILLITTIVMMLFLYITVVVEWKNYGLYNNDPYESPVYSTGYIVALTIFGALGIFLLIITAIIIPNNNITFK